MGCFGHRCPLYPFCGALYRSALLPHTIYGSIFGLFAMSFNVLFGYTGLLTVGHAAYFGIGAYIATFLLKADVFSMPLSIVCAMFGAGIAALVIGSLCIRVTEIYFGILTLAFGEMVYTIAFKWQSFTGGDDGIVGVPRPNFLGLNVASTEGFYWFSLVVVLLALFVLWRIINSPFGQAIQAIRENIERAKFVGLPVKRYELLSFVIAGIFAGLAGALYTCFRSLVHPEFISWTTSAEAIIMSLLGGVHVFLGPMVGAAIYLLLKHFIMLFTKTWMIYLGIVLVLVVIFLPGGIAGFLREKISAKKDTHEAP
jgi:branched-chain amino acid transport system permease protein